MTTHQIVRFIHQVILTILTITLVSCTVSPTMTPIKTTPEPTTMVPSGSVEVWLTLGDASKKLSHEPDLTFSEGIPASARQITIDQSSLYQQFEGAGASMTESSAWLIMSVLDSTSRNDLMRNLFTREGDGIGLSYLRNPMGASDFAFKDYSYDDLPLGQADPELKNFSIDHDKAYIIPALKLALELNPQLGIMGSPWSPPAWMKKDGLFHGAYLLPEYFQAFADYHIKFIQAYAAEGITIESITPQNEPMYSTRDYPTMYMSAADQQKLVRDYLGPGLAAAGLDTKLLIFDHNWDLVDYPKEVLADPAAAKYVDGVAFHCYGGDVSAQEQIHNLYPDIGIWFTECSGGGWATNFGDNLSWNMRNLVISNYRYWGKSTILWNLALNEKSGPQNHGCGDCRGVVTIDEATGGVTYNEEYYVLGHVTKFVDRGAYRVDSTLGGNGLPNNVAFLNPDGSLVLIVQSDTPITFEVAWNGKYFTYSLPSPGAVTFRWPAKTINETSSSALVRKSTSDSAGSNIENFSISNVPVDYKVSVQTKLNGSDSAHTLLLPVFSDYLR